jgi:hypothetical protein
LNGLHTPTRLHFALGLIPSSLVGRRRADITGF